MDQDNPVSIHDDIKLGFRFQGHAFEINVGHPQSDFTTTIHEGLAAILIVQPRYFVELLIRSDQFDPYFTDLWIPCYDDAQKQRYDGSWKVQCKSIC